MKIVITKTLCEMINVDRKVNAERMMLAIDLEAYRKQVMKSNPGCRSVRFTYEEIPG